MRMLGIDGSRRVDITIGFLRRGDLVDQAVYICPQLRIWIYPKRVRRSFNYLIWVGIVKREWRVVPVLDSDATKYLGSTNEILDPPCPLTLIESRRDADLAICFDLWGPKLIVHVHLRERNWFDRVIAFRSRWLL